MQIKRKMRESERNKTNNKKKYALVFGILSRLLYSCDLQQWIYDLHGHKVYNEGLHVSLRLVLSLFVFIQTLGYLALATCDITIVFIPSCVTQTKRLSNATYNNNNNNNNM